MNTSAHDRMTLPAEREVQAASRSQRALAALLSTRLETQRIQIFDDKDQAHQVELPTSALRILLEVLAELAAGNAVEVVPVHAELTTQEAANLLNVSRPHLVKLLEGGTLPFHRAGKHRRVHLADVMAFKERRDQTSHEAMAALARPSQEFDMPMPLTPPDNDPGRDSMYRRLDAKAAIASAAMEGLVVPSVVRELLDRYAAGKLTAAELVSEGLRINAQSIKH